LGEVTLTEFPTSPIEAEKVIVATLGAEDIEEPAAGDAEIKFASPAATARFGLSTVSTVSRQALKANLKFFITPLN
jgi:hypothetical protein